MQAASNLLQKHLGGENHPDAEVKVLGDPAPDGSTYRALAWFGNQDVRMVNAPQPTISDPKDAILKITGTTICGSDLHLYHAEIVALQRGDILGHEFMGIVEAVGSDVTHVKLGDRVVSAFQTSCGSCRYCKEKLSSFCNRTNPSTLMNAMYGGRDAGFFGYSHFTGGFPGGQAEMVRVPYAPTTLLKLPSREELPDEAALYLSDVLPTSYHCVVDTGVTDGDVVGVWGLGPIGLAACKWAQIKGASRVIGIDKVPHRLQHAQKKLGIEVIDFTKDDPVKKLQELVPGGIDKALDCGTFHEPKTWLHTVQKAAMLETDVPETANEMIKSLRKGGSAGLISVYAMMTNQFYIGPLMEKGIRFIGNGQAPVRKYWEEILNDYLLTGKFDPIDLFVSHRFDLEDFPKIYATYNARDLDVMKPFVQTKYSGPPGKGAPSLTQL